jgi:hypothetical protein
VTRAERRTLARETRKQALGWPAHLVEIPDSQWPPRRPDIDYPLQVWRSRQYLVMRYPAPAFQGVEARRLTINRVTVNAAGHWDADIPWDDLQRCKRETDHGDWYAVEVYPRERDIVHVANMRHLWLLAEPLAIGWLEGVEP